MKEFKVPGRTVLTTLHFHDGSTVRGGVFVPSLGLDGATGKLVDRLNDDGEHFVPMAEDDRRELVNKEWIVWLRPEDPGEARAALPSAGDEHRVRVTMVGEGRFEGTVRFAMRRERSRLLDYLNAAPRFIAIEGATESGEATLVNRRFITRLEDLSGDRT